MGIQPSELENITPYEFQLLVEGYNNRQIAEWERARFIAHKVIAVAVKDPPTVEQLLPLPTDKKRELTRFEKINSISDEEKKELEEIFNRARNGRSVIGS